MFIYLRWKMETKLSNDNSSRSYHDGKCIFEDTDTQKLWCTQSTFSSVASILYVYVLSVYILTLWIFIKHWLTFCCCFFSIFARCYFAVSYMNKQYLIELRLTIQHNTAQNTETAYRLQLGCYYAMLCFSVFCCA